MSVSCLQIVFDSIVICKILYASPAWFGYVNNDHVNLIQKLLSKALRWGLSGKGYDARDMLSDRDLHLFEIACRPYHCLYHLLPPERHVGYDLRDRGHSHELIAHKYKMTRSSFIVRI